MVAELVPLGARNDGHVERRSAAMQEKARALYTCGAGCGHAHRWAARLLITPAAFLGAARQTASIPVIADLLMVTIADVEAYLDGLSVNEFRIMRELVGHELV